MNSNQHIKPISVFASPTLWGVIFTLIIAVNPAISSILTKKKLTLEDGWNLIYLIASAGLTMTLRISEGASPVFTPKGMPGPDKSDFSLPTSTTANTIEVLPTELTNKVDSLINH